MVTIGEIRPEVPGVTTYRLDFADPQVAASFAFRPGQFNMLYLPGIGESAISISSDAGEPKALLHTVRAAGERDPGAGADEGSASRSALRGPFGSSWPMEACAGQDVVIACGGIGLAPLRPAIYHIVRHRDDYGRVPSSTGPAPPATCSTPTSTTTGARPTSTVEATVDIGDGNWRGNIGVVPVLFCRYRFPAARTHVLTCGPEVMIRFVVFEALARKIPREQIYLSMERNMNCAIGLCGHCQLGPSFICKDGPVFTYRQMEPYMHVEDF